MGGMNRWFRQARKPAPETVGQRGPVYELGGIRPSLGSRVYVAPTAAVIGNVRVGEGASIWFSAVVRGDDMPVRIGAGTNVQDGAVIHATEGQSAVEIGRDVVIGHAAVLHGCSIGDGALIGIGAVILDGAVVGAGAVVAAGSVVPPGRTVPNDRLWIGNPGTDKRPVSAEEKLFLAYAAPHYRKRAGEYAASGIGREI